MKLRNLAVFAAAFGLSLAAFGHDLQSVTTSRSVGTPATKSVLMTTNGATLKIQTLGNKLYVFLDDSSSSFKQLLGSKPGVPSKMRIALGKVILPNGDGTVPPIYVHPTSTGMVVSTTPNSEVRTLSPQELRQIAAEGTVKWFNAEKGYGFTTSDTSTSSSSEKTIEEAY